LRFHAGIAFNPASPMTVWLLPINKPAAGTAHGGLHRRAEILRKSLAHLDGGYFHDLCW
jgi:hypothetical protein